MGQFERSLWGNPVIAGAVVLPPLWVDSSPSAVGYPNGKPDIHPTAGPRRNRNVSFRKVLPRSGRSTVLQPALLNAGMASRFRHAA
jgi:hypothetical protein